MYHLKIRNIKQGEISMTTFDVAIVGGSYAGLSAALPLARARRSVLVIDAGVRRNRFADASHGFLTQDGVAPGVIAQTAREQLMKYASVTWKNGTVQHASGHKNAFQITTSDGESFLARRLILASGVTDQLPAIPGLAQRWGQSVFHCPYCHGFELNQGRIGVLAVSELSMHQALMLPDWGSTTLFLNDRFSPDAQQLAALEKRQVQVLSGAVKSLEGDALILHMQDGRTFALDGLFTMPHTSPSPLAAQLQCELEIGATGAFIKTNEAKATSIDGVFACGDTARAAGSVTFAVGDGAMAGLSAHRSLMFED